MSDASDSSDGNSDDGSDDGSDSSLHSGGEGLSKTNPIIDTLEQDISGAVTPLIYARSTHRFTTRDATSDLAKIKGGVLVKNGKQTSCELAVINSQVSVISADCLDIANGNLDTNVKYDVYLDEGADGNAAKYAVESVSINPGYNATSISNNLAVIQYNLAGASTWNNTMAVSGTTGSWNDMVFVRRTLSNVANMDWEAPVINTIGSNDDNMCNSMSALYKENQSDFICNSETLNPQLSSLSQCSITYGSVYTYIGSSLYLAGVHSYSATYSGARNLCGSNETRIYYLLLENYWEYISTVIKSSVPFYPSTSSLPPTQNAYYAMKEPENAKMLSNYRVFGGDSYANQTDSASQQSDTSPNNNQSAAASDFLNDSNVLVESSDAGSNLENNSSDSVDGADGQNNGSGDGLSHKDTIIIGVCASVGGILISCLLFFLYKVWSYRKSNKEDPMAQGVIQDMFVDDNGGAADSPHFPEQDSTDDGIDRTVAALMDYDLPPVYEGPAGSISPTSVLASTSVYAAASTAHTPPNASSGIPANTSAYNDDKILYYNTR
ncbi:hypothetical protein GGI25_003642 [Coemansia spiralis]|uniref:Uncharacterized protein n=1 Tax=Coemansia spiralis TaxID=417178 RepID=A0A9W8KXD5_9FUNG|nr:hypothetical protein GGI25_003642 [Coemansia spiralis]